MRINVDLGVEDDGAGGLSRPRRRRATSLSRVVDYEAVADAVRAIVAAGPCRLVETLAERIAEACLADPRVVISRGCGSRSSMCSRMQHPPGVEIERRRADLSTRVRSWRSSNTG